MFAVTGFIHPLKVFFTVDWNIYGHLVQASVELLNTIGLYVHRLTNAGGETNLHPFDPDSLEDSE